MNFMAPLTTFTYFFYCDSLLTAVLASVILLRVILPSVILLNFTTVLFIFKCHIQQMLRLAVSVSRMPF
jgi:hypothetical protein